MLKAIINGIPVLACFLCLCTITASLDRLPDPPAIKPHVLGVTALSASTPFQGSAHQAEAIPVFRSWLLAKPGLSSRSIPEGGVPLHQPALMQEAADVSPPVRKLANIA